MGRRQWWCSSYSVMQGDPCMAIPALQVLQRALDSSSSLLFPSPWATGSSLIRTQAEFVSQDRRMSPGQTKGRPDTSIPLVPPKM